MSVKIPKGDINIIRKLSGDNGNLKIIKNINYI